MAEWPQQRTGPRPSADEEQESSPPGPELNGDNGGPTTPAGETPSGPRTGTATGRPADSGGDDLDGGTGVALDPSSWRASLPEPADLAGYEDTVKGAGERILTMVENAQAVHNKAREDESEAGVRSATRNQYIAMLLIVLGFGASVAFFLLGNTVAGVIYVCIPIVVMLRMPPSYRA
jgi:uncharacterized membrane protein